MIRYDRCPSGHSSDTGVLTPLQRRVKRGLAVATTLVLVGAAIVLGVWA